MQERNMLNKVLSAIDEMKTRDVQSYVRLHAEVSYIANNEERKIRKHTSNCRDTLSNAVCSDLVEAKDAYLKCIKTRATRDSYRFWIGKTKHKRAVNLIVKHTIEKSMKTYLNKNVVINSKNSRALNSYITFNASLVNNSVDFYLLLGQARWIISFLCILYSQLKKTTETKPDYSVLNNFIDIILKGGKLLDKTSDFLVDTFKNEKYGWACSIRGGYSESVINVNRTTNLVIRPKFSGPIKALIAPQQTTYDNSIHELHNIFFLANKFRCYDERMESFNKIKRINLFCQNKATDGLADAIATPTFSVTNDGDNLNDDQSIQVENLSKLLFNLTSEAILKEMGSKKLLDEIKETAIKDLYRLGNSARNNYLYRYYYFHFPEYFKPFFSTSPKERVVTLTNIYLNIINRMKYFYRFNLASKGKPLSLADDACNLLLNSLKELYQYTNITPIKYDPTKNLKDNIIFQWTESIDLCSDVGISLFSNFDNNTNAQEYSYDDIATSYSLRSKPANLSSFVKKEATKVAFRSYVIFKPVILIMDWFFKKILIDHEVKEVILKPSIHIKTNKPKSSSSKIAAKSRICHAAKRRS